MGTASTCAFSSATTPVFFLTTRKNTGKQRSFVPGVRLELTTTGLTFLRNCCKRLMQHALIRALSNWATLAFCWRDAYRIRQLETVLNELQFPIFGFLHYGAVRTALEFRISWWILISCNLIRYPFTLCCGWEDLNLQQTDSSKIAVSVTKDAFYIVGCSTFELHPHMVQRAGLEPATHSSHFNLAVSGAIRFTFLYYCSTNWATSAYSR